MSFDYLRLSQRPCSWIREKDDMAGVAAGVVTEAQLYSQPANQSKVSASLMQPGVWSFIWVGAALAYLISVYVGAIRITGAGE